MRKKLICTLLSALMLSGSTLALADEIIPVSVDKRTVYFNDQQPVIVNDRVLVPVRGVFEALGAKVLWDATERKVTVFSKDNLSRIILYIDSPEFKQVTFRSILDYDVKDFTSEVAPQIINDRTMIPLYLVADYMGNKAEWNDEERSVTVTSKERLKLLANTTAADNMTVEETLEMSLPKLSISADKTDVSTGEDVTVTLALSNVSEYSDSKYFGTSASIFYDKENFELKSCNYIIDCEDNAKAYNDAYLSDSVKYIYLHNPNQLPDLTDCTLAEFVFTAKNDNGGTFTLSDRLINTSHDTSLTIFTENKDLILSTADELYIDVSPITVN